MIQPFLLGVCGEVASTFPVIFGRHLVCCRVWYHSSKSCRENKIHTVNISLKWLLSLLSCRTACLIHAAKQSSYETNVNAISAYLCCWAGKLVVSECLYHWIWWGMNWFNDESAWWSIFHVEADLIVTLKIKCVYVERLWFKATRQSLISL